MIDKMSSKLYITRFLRPGTEQQMDVLGHDDVSEDAQFVSAHDSFQRRHKCFLRLGRVEERASLITGEVYEVRTLRLVETLESRVRAPGYSRRLF